MNTGTTLFEFRWALVHRLAARPGLAGVQVLYSVDKAELHNEAIWLGDADSTDLTPLVTQCPGPVSVDEAYAVKVVIQVLRTEGEGQEDADRRAAQLLAELQRELAGTPQTTGLIHQAELASWAHKQLTNNANGHGSRFDVTLAVEATLEP